MTTVHPKGGPNKESMRIVVDHDEPRVVALVRHMYGCGRTMPEIVSELRSMGVVTRTGVPIRLGQIWEILRAL